MRMIKLKVMALTVGTVKKRLPKLSMKPSTRPPSMAPGMLPIPPRITTRKAFKMTSPPRKGLTEKMGAIRAPAEPARAQPIPKDKALMRLT
jgi:hypothetical protein